MKERIIIEMKEEYSKCRFISITHTNIIRQHYDNNKYTSNHKLFGEIEHGPDLGQHEGTRFVHKNPFSMWVNIPCLQKFS
jgi:hypothetical protein